MYSALLSSLLTFQLCCSMTAGTSFTLNNSNLEIVHEGSSVVVCVIAEDVSTKVQVSIYGDTNSNSPSAIAGIDYTPEKIFLQFFPSSTGDTQWKCGEFSIVQDGLDEPEENFTLHLKQDNGNQILDSKTISINACKNNTILLRPLKEEHSIVEVCTNEEVWSTLCDHHWTELDARVACRQAGYNDTEKATAFHIANPIFAAMESPKCAGNESSLTECEGDPRPLEKQCYPVLVKCGTSKAQSSGAGGHVVTASVISSLFGTLTICATLLTVIILCYKFKIKSINNSLSMETGAPAKVLSKIHEANISKTPLQGVNRQKSNTKKSRESCKKPQVTLPHSSNAKPTKSDPTFLSVVNANYEAQQPAVFHTPQPSITAQYSMIEHVETCT